MKTLTILLSLLGLAAITAAMAWNGFGSVVHAVTRIGALGFLVTILAQLAVDAVLGLAWHAAFPRMLYRHLLTARLVRDAAATCLPFSQLGGILLGIKATCARGEAGRPDRAPIEWPEAACANVVDITTEVLGQIVFILLAVALLVVGSGANPLTKPVVIGACLLSVGIAGFIWTQQRGGTAVKRAVSFLGRHIAGQWQSSMISGADTLQERMEDAWSHPRQIMFSASFHLLGWIGSAGILWLTYRLLGAHLTFANSIAIEGVTCGIMSASFIVPAGLGVQEGAYMTLGHAFGIDPSISLGLSLLRRGRELCIGIPVLLLWQTSEVRSLRHQDAAATSPDTESAATSERVRRELEDTRVG